MKDNIAVVGLGYVGLPLFIALNKHFNTIGFDINKKRVNNLKQKYDINNEFQKDSFKKVKQNKITHNLNDIKNCNIYIITVPTPIYKNKKPNLSHIIQATKNISKIMNKDNFIIYECTVYPGLIEEVCIPIINKISKLELNKDYFCGYSPERINPGDKKHTLENTIKIVSASNNYSLNYINKIYSKIIKAGTKKVDSIKVAEAAKVIENAQRDLNIAFVNELAIIFNKLKIDTHQVLSAASTKWNFLNFTPGLVGGHCIGVDPYYLTYKANKIGYDPKIILAGRDINNKMKLFFLKIINKQISLKFKNYQRIKILFAGITFKENCSDIRNSQSIELLKKIKNKYQYVDVYDPLLKNKKIHEGYNLKLIEKPKKNFYNVVILSVPHKKIIIKNKNYMINKYCNKNSIIFDFKNYLKKTSNIIQL